MVYRIFGILVSLFLIYPLKAQTESEVLQVPEKNIIIEESGNIIEIPYDIFKNLETNPKNLHKPTPGNIDTGGKPRANNYGSRKNNENTGKSELKPGVYKKQGFRIQVFSDGRNPATLQARARARGNAIIAKFPKYRGQVYSFSQAPNWYTRIGNFQTSEEASKALVELKRAFPGFATEMRVVKSSITIIK